MFSILAHARAKLINVNGLRAEFAILSSGRVGTMHLRSKTCAPCHYLSLTTTCYIRVDYIGCMLGLNSKKSIYVLIFTELCLRIEIIMIECTQCVIHTDYEYE